MDRGYVFSGELKVCKPEGKLSSGAIGSCIVAIMISATPRIGAMAHIMLPGKAPEKESNTTKYTCNAINELYNQMTKRGALNEDIKTFVFGGANVLRDKNTDLPQSNISSVKSCLKELGLKIGKESVGGIERREVILNMKDMVITLSEGGSGHIEFWTLGTNDSNNLGGRTSK